MAKNTLSWVLLAAAVLLLLLPFLPPQAASWLLVVGYAALPIILANVLAAIMRKSPWRWAHLATVLLSLPLIYNYIPLIPRKAKTATHPIKIISWNVDNFLVSTDTMRHSTQYLRSQHPDIICLQERPHEVKVAWTDILDALPQHRHAVRNSHEDEVLNLAILSRHPIIASGERTFDDTYNKYMWADIHIHADTLRVYSVHLQTTGTGPSAASGASSSGITHTLRSATHHAVMRNQQARQLFHDINHSPHPVVVCGDFNDTPSGYPARLLRRQLTDISRRWPLCGTYKGMGDIMKIDYMMCSSTLTPLTYHLTDTPWSDHKIQIATINN